MAGRGWGIKGWGGIGAAPSPFTGCAGRAPSLSRWEREGGAERRKGEGAPYFASRTLGAGANGLMPNSG